MCDLELLPQLPLGAPMLLGNRRQCQKNRAVGEIGPADDILDAIEKDRPRRLKEHLVGVGVQLAQPKACAGREPAKLVRQHMGQAG